MPVLVKWSANNEEVFEEFKIIRNQTFAEVQEIIDTFIENFEEEHNGEITPLSGYSFHEDDFSPEAFEVFAISESEADALEKYLGASFGLGALHYVFN